MDGLPISVNLNTNSEPCSSVTTENPRMHCPICIEQSKELLKSMESLSAKTPNNIEQRPLTGQDEKLTEQMLFKDATEGNNCSNLNDICSAEHRMDFSIPRSTEKDEGSTSNLPEVSKKDLDQYNMKDCDKIWSSIKNIQDFLEKDEKNYEEFLVPENILKKKVLLMGNNHSNYSFIDEDESRIKNFAKYDIFNQNKFFPDIVQTECNHSCCFTKGYGHYVEGTGSVVQMSSLDSSSVFEKYSKANEQEKIRILAPLELRYFTPREIANILCFPKHFDFPKSVTTKQKYRLLGNSLNVLVVKELMKILFSSTNQ